MQTFETIYQRNWDNPTNPDGSKKESIVLGEFQIVEKIAEDSYTSLKIGRLRYTDKLFIISEKEITGNNGGSLFEIFECKNIIHKTLEN